MSTITVDPEVTDLPVAPYPPVPASQHVAVSA